MQNQQTLTIDGNQAAASIAFKLNEVIAIYPITPSSPMGEWSDEWASQGLQNLLGTIPQVIELQSVGEDALPILFELGLLVRELDRAVLVFEFFDQDINFVADLEARWHPEIRWWG